MGIISGANLISDGLVYSLDAANFRSYSGSGLTSNALVGGIGGTLVNGVGFTSASGGSFVFDGTNDYIELGTSLQNYSVFTTSFWINYNFFDGSHRSPLGDDSGQFSYHILLWSGSIWLGFPSSYVGITHNNVSINTWYNFVVTKNSSHSVSFYQDSLLLGSDFVEAGKLASINKIGKGYVYDNAKISNVSFYNRALSPKEIKQNYNATKRRYSL